MDINQIRTSNTRAAVQRYGGQTALARRLGVTQPGVRQWILNGVPLKRLKEFCEATDSRATEIRPDIAEIFFK